MTDLTGAVQLAIWAKLSAAEGLPPVVSEVPLDDSDQPVYPFILLGDDQVTNHGTKSHRLERHEVSIHTCFQSVPKLAVRTAQDLVRAALEDEPITSDGAVLSNPQLITSSTPLLDDGATYVATTIFGIFAQDAS